MTRAALRRAVYAAVIAVTVGAGLWGASVAPQWFANVGLVVALLLTLMRHDPAAPAAAPLLVFVVRAVVLWFAFMGNAVVLVSVPAYLALAGSVIALAVAHRLLRPSGGVHNMEGIR